MAAATLGLVIASLVGGPVAGLLISRHGLNGPVDETPWLASRTTFPTNRTLPT